ncbi:MAG: TIGR02206 family membrane protein [Clostridia bacterium]|nr:TIGR02206 family membrane protein [Clostridia bacterium]
MFFSTKSNIPEGVGFSTFGTTHLLWLLCIALFWVLAVIFYKRSDTKRRRALLITAGIITVALEVIKDVVAIVLGNFGVGNLPLHLCGINILLILFDMFKPTKAVRSFLYYFCIPGALLALLFPNWTVLPCFNFSHIHSFLIHAFLVLYPLLLVAEGEVTPKIKDILKCALLLIIMAIPIYFINLLCDTNFMFLMEPETGNPLGLFEKYLGSHLWGFPVLLPIVMFIMYIPLYFIHKAKSNNKTQQK